MKELKLTREICKEWFGYDGEPRDFRRDWDRAELSSRYVMINYQKLMSTYPKWWIAVLDGEVRVKARTPQALHRKMDRLRLPRFATVIRYMDPVHREFARIGGQLVEIRPSAVRQPEAMPTPKGWQEALDRSLRRRQRELSRARRESN